MAAEDLDQLLVYDLDDLLGWRERRQHFFAHRLQFDVLDELFDNAEVDVGLEQRQTDFTQGALHVLGAELALAAKILEYALKLFRKVVKHGSDATPGCTLRLRHHSLEAGGPGYRITAGDSYIIPGKQTTSGPGTVDPRRGPGFHSGAMRRLLAASLPVRSIPSS